MLYQLVRVQIALKNAIEKVAESIVNRFGSYPCTSKGKQAGVGPIDLIILFVLVGIVVYFVIVLLGPVVDELGAKIELADAGLEGLVP